jgi:2-polyprenyl-3-methyl-5-hydroxy-6-metoxy-1,4-benzoquinol methylase
MSEVRRRPFYTEYAWPFDLLIDRLFVRNGAVIAGVACWIAGALPGSEILDAGCGTGRYCDLSSHDGVMSASSRVSAHMIPT